MSRLLAMPPFSERDDAALLEEMNAVTRHHLEHSAEYRRIWPRFEHAGTLDALPYLHAGVFKHLLMSSASGRTRTLVSSGTAGAQSRIVLDADAAKLQSESSRAILADFIGTERTPLLILDHASALRSRDAIPARIAAAMAVQPFASETDFVLDANGALDDAKVASAIAGHEHIRVYAVTSLLWTHWSARWPHVRIDFVHSGGWKKLEAMSVDRGQFEKKLLDASAPGSRVVDFYGLVEQNGVIYPLCAAGFRHAPVWAEVIVRDPFTLEPLEDGVGLLQMMNPIPRGAPTHSVLTEDLGRMIGGDCTCGRRGRRFELLGRLPKAELRGCANV